MDVSIVVPLRDEGISAGTLRLDRRVVTENKISYEIILVDDGMQMIHAGHRDAAC